jgi:hypothetical protein
VWGVWGGSDAKTRLWVPWHPGVAATNNLRADLLPTRVLTTPWPGPALAGGPWKWVVSLLRFSTRGVQKHHKKLFGESLCQKLLAEKVEKKKLFPFVFSHRIFFYRVFWPFLYMRSPKTP